jgi:hypothetical protein
VLKRSDPTRRAFDDCCEYTPPVVMADAQRVSVVSLESWTCPGGLAGRAEANDGAPATIEAIATSAAVVTGSFTSRRTAASPGAHA